MRIKGWLLLRVGRSVLATAMTGTTIVLASLSGAAADRTVTRHLRLNGELRTNEHYVGMDIRQANSRPEVEKFRNGSAR